MDTIQQRVRVNVKQTSKGESYFDITCESEKPDESVRLFGETVDLLRAECALKGLRLIELV